MPIGGENVGQVYVRVLADGQGLSKSIADDLDDVDDIYEGKGREHAELHDKAFRKQLRKDRPVLKKEIEGIFDTHSRRAKQIAAEMGTNFFKELERNVIKQNGRAIGERIMRDIRSGFTLSGGDYDDFFGENFEKLFKRMPAMTRTAAIEINREWARMYDEAHRMNVRFDADRLKSITTQQRQIEQLARAEDQAYRERDLRYRQSADRAIRAFQRIERGEKKAGESMRQSIRRTINHVQELAHELDRSPNLGGGERDTFRATFRDMETGLNRVSPRLRRFNTVLAITTPRIGRAFGKGSRNDFVNFTGAAIEGISRLIFSVPKITEKVIGFGKAFGATFIEARKAQGIFGALMTSLRGVASGAGSLGTSLLAAGVAIPVVITVVGTLVAALSMLLGVITALASTISFALVGALGVLAGAMAPLAAGIAVVTAGIISMSDEQKKALGQAIRPFTREMKTLGQIANRELFRDAPSQARRLGKVFEGLRPLVRGVAISIREVADSWIDALEGPGFKRFKAEMTKFLPGAVKSLGETFGNVMGGIGGLFVGLIPSTERFLGWLNRITDRFADWANSAKGQNEIKEFMDDALESAKALGKFIGQVGGLLKDLLFNDEGKRSGDSMFTGMADAIERFRDYIADGKLEKWFKDATEFATNLGEAIRILAKFLDTLDNAFTRFMASAAVAQFTSLMFLLDQAVSGIGEGFSQGISRIGDAFGNLAEGFSTGLARIGGFFQQAWQVGADLIGGIVQGVGDAVGDLVSAIGSIPRRLIEAFTVPLGIASPSTVFMAFGRDIIMGLIQGITSVLTLPVSLLVGLAGRMSRAFMGVVGPAFDAAKRKAGELGAALSGKLGSAVQWIRGKASDFGGYLKGQFSGALSAARERVGSLATRIPGLSTAMRGASTVAGGVRTAMGKLRDSIGWVIDKVQSLITWLGRIKVPKISLPSIGGLASKLFSASGSIMTAGAMVTKKAITKRMAAGGFANFAQNYQIGESGREAIVPLDRPLNQVDPAVRLLSAFAQGKLGSLGNNDNSKTIDASGWIIQSPNDSATVAKEVLDAITAKLV